MAKKSVEAEGQLPVPADVPAEQVSEPKSDVVLLDTLQVGAKHRLKAGDRVRCAVVVLCDGKASFVVHTQQKQPSDRWAKVVTPFPKQAKYGVELEAE